MPSNINPVRLFTAAAAAIAIGYWVYRRYYSQAASDEDKNTVDTVKATVAEEAKVKDKKINLAQASREDVMLLLREVSEVQRQLAALMERVMKEVSEKDLDIVQTYQLLRKSEPADPLETHGLSIAGFDSLLERFSSDREVHQMIIEVIQGPSPPTDSAFQGRTLKDLSVDTLVQINAAMRDKLREAADELIKRQAELGDKYEGRTASLTAQSMVGAFVQKHFGVTPEEVERSMSVYTFQLSSREDFSAINDDIQAIMTKLQNAVSGRSA